VAAAKKRRKKALKCGDSSGHIRNLKQSIFSFNICDFNFCFVFVVPEIGKVRGNLFQINGKKNEPLVSVLSKLFSSSLTL